MECFSASSWIEVIDNREGKDLMNKKTIESRLIAQPSVINHDGAWASATNESAIKRSSEARALKSSLIYANANLIKMQIVLRFGLILCNKSTSSRSSVSSTRCTAQRDVATSTGLTMNREISFASGRDSIKFVQTNIT